MKIGKTKLDNTKLAILNATKRGGTFSAAWLVAWFWPNTRQQHKKQETIRRHLVRLERMGFVRMVGLSPAGAEIWIRTDKPAPDAGVRAL